MEPQRFDPRDPAQNPQTATPGDLFNQLFQRMNDQMHEEIQLSRAEMARDIKPWGARVGVLSAAGMFLLLGIACMATAAMIALANQMEPWQAALLMGVTLLVIGAIIAVTTMSRQMQGPTVH